MVKVKRAFDPPAAADGKRFLVDRMWPRGVKKDDLKLEVWLKDVAPSTELRQWFGHKPERWDEFRRRYFAELDGKRGVWEPLAVAAALGTLTLVYAAKDAEHNNAVALREYLERQVRE